MDIGTFNAGNRFFSYFARFVDLLDKLRQRPLYSRGDIPLIFLN